MICKLWHAILGALIIGGCGGNTAMHLGDTGAGGSAAGGAEQISAGGQSGIDSTHAGTGGSVVAAADAGMATPACAVNAGQSVPLILTNLEYARTVRDLLGVSIADDFPPDESGGFAFTRDIAPVSSIRLDSYAKAASNIAMAAKGRLAAISPCDPASAGEDVCANQFIGSFGPRAFRRPLTPAETNTLHTAYVQNRTNSDFANGVAGVITAALTSAPFYTLEDPKEAGTVTPLGPYPIASRLSYFIYRSMPDQALFDAAAAGKLTTSGDIEVQAGRMLANPKAHDGVVQFFSEWLSLDRLATATKDPMFFYPTFDAVRTDMATETTKFVESIFFGDGKWKSLLQSTQTWGLSAPLAALYDLNGESGDLKLDSKVRAGILTQASFLSIASGSVESSPTLRGKFVREKLLCQPVPPPPANIEVLLPLSPGQTNRARYVASIAVSPACAACHQLMDPIGYGFEEFDAIGRFRTSDNGGPVDATGNFVNANTIEGPFNGAVEMAGKLASSPATQDCATLQWFRFALSRAEAEEDACSIATAQQAIHGSDSMVDLVVAIAKTDAFRNARW